MCKRALGLFVGLACPGTRGTLVAEGLPVEASLNWGHGPTSNEGGMVESGV
jgi:hypothetical protein